MRLGNRKIYSLLVIACLLAAILPGCSGKTPDEAVNAPANANEAEAEPAAEPEESGGTASQLGSLASFTAGTLDGDTFTQADLQEKDVTIINFWSLTCRPCIAEMPDLAAYAKALPDNVQLITVCLDGSGNEDITKEVLQNAGFDGVTLISGSGDLVDLCSNLMYTPTTLFADSDGQLAGDPITGMQADLPGVYTAAVNQVLAAGGKAEISVE